MTESKTKEPVGGGIDHAEDLRVKIPVSAEITKMAETGELYEFLLAESVKFLNHAVESCKQAKVPKEQRGGAINRIAKKYNMTFYNGLFVKYQTVEVIPKIFREAIDSKNPKQAYDGEPNQNNKPA